MRYCEACGEATNHTVEFAAALLDMLFMRTAAILPSSPAKLARPLMGVLVRLRITHVLEAYDEKTLLLDQMLWAEAHRRGIRMREYRPLGSVRNTFSASLPDGSTLFFEGVPPLGQKGAWWVNDKGAMLKRFKKAGLPVPRGGTALTRAGARRLAQQIGFPLVVKPSMGSASRHTTMHVNNVEALERAYTLARQLSPAVAIQEELVGAVYRPTLVGGRLVAVLRRDQPHVIGDGRSTIAQLVDAANDNPARRGPLFSALKLDTNALAELAYQQLKQESIPAPGQRVLLGQKINWSLGGTTVDVTDDVHPENRALFERAAALLKAPLVGFDFIAEDICKPWRTQRAGFIEANDMPYFDNHHLPFDGKPRDIAGPVWDLALRQI